MNTIELNDLEKNQELDRSAISQIVGGAWRYVWRTRRIRYTYTRRYTYYRRYTSYRYQRYLTRMWV